VIGIPSQIKLQFLGGAQEVGRSALLLKGGRTQVLLDYGVLIGREPGFPSHVSSRDVHAIILTHAHLDHSGAVPIFHVTTEVPVYGTRITQQLSKMLITDFIHLSRYYLPYEFLDLQTMMSRFVDLEYRQPTRIRGLGIELLNSGHIPGSAQVEVEWRGKHVLYTSDFNPYDTQLLHGADQAYHDINALIIESTYADEEHQNRETEEQRFMAQVNQIAEGGGTVLIPSFSVGRAQEILCLLAANNFQYSTVVDGMAIIANEIVAKNLKYVRDPTLYKKALSRTSVIRGWKDRRRATKRPGVIVSPAGMLTGGNAVFYMNSVAKKAKNGVFLVSYQVPDSPGRRLLESRRFIISGKTRKVKAEIDHFDFTSHAGKTGLLETVKRVDCSGPIFVVHGAEENCRQLALAIRETLGFEAIAPNTGEVYKA
jgi:putative mRNA 3-end processing factor